MECEGWNNLTLASLSSAQCGDNKDFISYYSEYRACVEKEKLKMVNGPMIAIKLKNYLDIVLVL